MNILSFTVGFLLLVILSVVIVAEFFPSVSAQKMRTLQALRVHKYGRLLREIARIPMKS
jgi:hypothetical protein